MPDSNEILAAIRAELTAIKVPGGDEAAPEQSWQDLDVDSLELVELVKALEDRFGIVIADAELKGLATVGDAVDAIEAKAAAESAA